VDVLVVASVRAQQPHFIRFLIILSVKTKKITAKLKSKLYKSSSEAASVILVTFLSQSLKRNEGLNKMRPDISFEGKLILNV
jgi:hypothetical protein